MHRFIALAVCVRKSLNTFTLHLILEVAKRYMQYSFSYDKKQVLQGLRRHFFSRPEIRVMLLLVNVFAITAAVLYYMHKIRPEPFLLGSCVWLFLMVGVWFVLPYAIYKKSSTFLDAFTIYFNEDHVRLETERGYVNWEWKQFSSYFESDSFFHLYFNTRSFFLVPKETMSSDMQHELRAMLKQKIGR
jgi:hypothetical protein